jgi:hypothetical protein
MVTGVEVVNLLQTRQRTIQRVIREPPLKAHRVGVSSRILEADLRG